MLTIRFARVGKKNKAQFKIMLQEHTAAPGGRHIEVLGSYDPHQKVAVLKDERIKYWIEKGAKLSDTVHNLLVSKNVISDKKRTVKVPKKEVPAETAETPAEAKEEAKPEEKAEEAKTENKAEGIKDEAKPEEKTESADAKAIADKEAK